MTSCTWTLRMLQTATVLLGTAVAGCAHMEQAALHPYATAKSTFQTVLDPARLVRPVVSVVGAPSAALVMTEPPEVIIERYSDAANIPNIWPIDNTEKKVISPYGPRASGRRRSRFHAGMDIKAPRKTPVVATAGGVVTSCGYEGDYGNIVVVDHANGYSSAYSHLESFTVTEGQHVKRSEVVGLLGATGNATTPHVHYEVRLETKPVDPMPYLPAD